jgi:hypothetical protein
MEKAGISQTTPVIFNIILKTWVDLNPMEDVYPMLPKIIDQLTPEASREMVKSLDFTYRNLIIKLAPYNDEPFVESVMRKLDMIFGLQNYKVYSLLMEAILPAKRKIGYEQGIVPPIKKEEESCKLGDCKIGEPVCKKIAGSKEKEMEVDPNFYLLNCLQSRLEDVSPFAARPSYILDKEVEDYPNDFNSLRVIPIPDVEEAVSLAMGDLRQYMESCTNEADASDGFRESYLAADDIYLKLHLLLPLYEELFLQDDDELTRVYGPQNTFISEKSGIDISIDGRMFRCNHYNESKLYDPFRDEGDDDLEWFTGVCKNSKCSKRISYYHYAFRMPMAAGGWSGCYCSPSCVLKDLPKSKDPLHHMIGPRNIIAHLTRIFAAKIKKTGIYDRNIERDEGVEEERNDNGDEKEKERQAAERRIVGALLNTIPLLPFPIDVKR